YVGRYHMMGYQDVTPAISVAGLSRRYRGQLALDNVSFDLEPGSITGLLGRNGAGKTTLLRIVAGAEFPSAGSVPVLGASLVTSDALLHRMVFVREDQRYPDYGLPGGFKVWHALRAPPGSTRAGTPSWPGRWSPTSAWPPGPRGPCSTSPTRDWTRWPGSCSTTRCWPTTPP